AVEDRGVGVRRSSPELISMATTGVAGLEDYAAKFLPQLVIASLVPFGILIFLATQDVESAIILASTLPLIPIFMMLIGWHTQKHTQRQYRLLQILAHRFTDIVTGLSTLKAFDRSKAQTGLLRRADESHKSGTMKTLRIAFLSSLVLELLATLSVALIAVSIGLRLVSGSLDLRTGLTVLLVAPEAYLAIRAVGAHFHSSVDGLTAADHIFGVLDEPLPPQGTQWPQSGPIALVGVEVAVGHDRRNVVVPDLRIESGKWTAVIGPSGSGKTTALNLIAGLVRPAGGVVTISGISIDQIDPAKWVRHVAYVGQQPYLTSGTVADNLRLMAGEATDAQLNKALWTADLDVEPTLMLHEGGAPLSAGQQQRLAIARAVLAAAPIILLDEATSCLDLSTEATVLDRLRAAFAGSTIVIATHRRAVIEAADQVIDLSAAGVTS
ncbi:MAG: thiol reductant ABC exporter subunit CydD, partial [Antricoccus sp.]